VFINKLDDFGSILKNKARLISKGYKQVARLDLCTPVTRLEAIKIMLAITSLMDAKLFPNGCEKCLPKWIYQGIIFCRATTRFH